MDLEHIKHSIRTFIVERMLMGTTAFPGDDASLLEHGILDSTGVLELVGFLQDTYGIKVEDHEMIPDNLDSLTALAAFVRSKKEGA